MSGSHWKTRKSLLISLSEKKKNIVYIQSIEKFEINDFDQVLVESLRVSR